ncbi:MAG TPA: hypothetical protein VFZ02_02630 [Ktedonobacteraceae bacterium]
MVDCCGGQRPASIEGRGGGVGRRRNLEQVRPARPSIGGAIGIDALGARRQIVAVDGNDHGAVGRHLRLAPQSGEGLTGRTHWL